MKKCFGSALLVAMLASGPVVAEDVKREARSGQKSTMLFFSIHDIDTCYAGPLAEARIIAQGEHGRAEVQAQKGRIGGQNCGPMEILGQNVAYASRPGFKGQDQFTVEFTWYPYVEVPRASTSRYTIYVQVK